MRWVTALCSVLIVVMGIALFWSKSRDLPPSAADFMRQATVYVDIGGGGHGSGVVISPNLVMTARHVIEGSRELSLYFFGVEEPVPAKVAWRSELTDIALLQAEVPDVIVPAEVDCGPPIFDEPIAVVGNPYIAQEVITRGTVASVIPIYPPGVSYPVTVIDVLINPGNSGGAVFSEDGRVRGIVKGNYGDVRTPGLPLMVASSDFCEQTLAGL